MKRKIILFKYPTRADLIKREWDMGFRWGMVVGMCAGFVIWTCTVISIYMMY